MRCFLAVMLATSSLFAQANVDRPHVLGLAHVAFTVSDLSRSKAFYEDILGLAEPFVLTDEDGRTTFAVLKVNDQQYIELFQGDNQNQGQLDHFALYTDDVVTMREYLVSRRVTLLRDLHEGRVGNSFLTVRDPDGGAIEIVEYSPASLTAQTKGRFLRSGGLVSHITHIGLLTRSVGPALRFYRDVLGLWELSRGAGGPANLGPIDLFGLEGGDHIELLPFTGVPSANNLKAQNYVCLTTADLGKAVAFLQSRAGGTAFGSRLAVQTGGNLPPHADLLDPDGARIEIAQAMPAAAPRNP